MGTLWAFVLLKFVLLPCILLEELFLDLSLRLRGGSLRGLILDRRVSCRQLLLLFLFQNLSGLLVNSRVG